LLDIMCSSFSLAIQEVQRLCPALLLLDGGGTPNATAAGMSGKNDLSTPRGAARQGRFSLEPTWFLALGGAAIMLEGCRVVGDIFRAGVFVGVVGVILCVALVVGLIRLLMS
jgi:hypothetical protein